MHYLKVTCNIESNISFNLNHLEPAVIFHSNVWCGRIIVSNSESERSRFKIYTTSQNTTILITIHNNSYITVIVFKQVFDSE